MIGPLGGQAARTLGERERRELFALATAVILGAAGLLLTLPPDPPRPPRAGTAPLAAAAAANRATPSRPQHEPAKAEATTRRFLRGYLAFLYGRGAASAIEATTAALRDQLADTRLRVPPAALRRHPRVTEVELRRVRGDRFAATAGVVGGAARYAIELTVARDHGRWRVAGVADH
ncbi:MAG: hypothetical protein QOD71_448 [Thermoleophilaceae bacterium]|jgi:hypothetical protein|nr:hypothetical protein [Thermoleophilaceae bacterium]